MQILIAFLLFVQDPATLTREEALQSITQEELKTHIGFLASDEMKGRNTPSKELDQTAAYVGNAFREAGLE